MFKASITVEFNEFNSHLLPEFSALMSRMAAASEDIPEGDLPSTPTGLTAGAAPLPQAQPGTPPVAPLRRKSGAGRPTKEQREAKRAAEAALLAQAAGAVAPAQLPLSSSPAANIAAQVPAIAAALPPVAPVAIPGFDMSPAPAAAPVEDMTTPASEAETTQLKTAITLLFRAEGGPEAWQALRADLGKSSIVGPRDGAGLIQIVGLTRGACAAVKAAVEAKTASLKR